MNDTFFFRSLRLRFGRQPAAPIAIAAMTAVAAITVALAITPATLFAGSNPPADGFDLAGSDSQAIAAADRTMASMGGRQAWDDTRFITWKFFGRRFHLWDKHTGDIRVEGVGREDKEPYVTLMNLNTKQGRAWRSGDEITEPEELAKMLEGGESAWINDSYWLVMPYKLKDTGVTLKYLGERSMADGRAAEALQLTFEGVGRTPENKYHVYVSKESGLVEQWDFFGQATDEEPRFTTPWHQWQAYGDIQLSADRGDNGHTEIAVYSQLPAEFLTDPAPIDWSTVE